MGQVISCLIGVVIGAVVFIIALPLFMKIVEIQLDFEDDIYDFTNKFIKFVKSFLKTKK